MGRRKLWNVSPSPDPRCLMGRHPVSQALHKDVISSNPKVNTVILILSAQTRKWRLQRLGNTAKVTQLVNCGPQLRWDDLAPEPTLGGLCCNFWVNLHILIFLP